MPLSTDEYAVPAYLRALSERAAELLQKAKFHTMGPMPRREDSTELERVQHGWVLAATYVDTRRDDDTLWLVTVDLSPGLEWQWIDRTTVAGGFNTVEEAITWLVLSYSRKQRGLRQ